MIRPHHLLTIVALALLATLASCDAQTVTCEGDDANCACTVDEDCVLTQYAAPVSSVEDCYDLPYCCPIELLPVAADAAETNEASWNDQGCVDGFDHAACPGCDPLDTVWAKCRRGQCVKTYQRVEPPQSQ